MKIHQLKRSDVVQTPAAESPLKDFLHSNRAEIPTLA